MFDKKLHMFHQYTRSSIVHCWFYKLYGFRLPSKIYSIHFKFPPFVRKSIQKGLFLLNKFSANKEKSALIFFHTF